VVKTKVEAGICGFVTDIEAYSEDSQFVSFNINSNCEKNKQIVSEDRYC